MSTKRERHFEIGAHIAAFLSNTLQERELMDFSSMIKTRRDMMQVKAEARAMSKFFLTGSYGVRKPRARIIGDGPPYDAATKTGMYDHDDSG